MKQSNLRRQTKNILKIRHMLANGKTGTILHQINIFPISVYVSKLLNSRVLIKPTKNCKGRNEKSFSLMDSIDSTKANYLTTRSTGSLISREGILDVCYGNHPSARNSKEQRGSITVMRNNLSFANINKCFSNHCISFSRGFKTRRSDSAYGLGSILKSKETEASEKSDNLVSLLAKIKESSKSSGKADDDWKIIYVENKESKKTNTGKRIVYWIIGGFVVYLILSTFVSVSVGTGNGKGSFKIFNNRSYEIDPEDVNVNFSDVKGVEEAKTELRDVVDFLRDPEKYSNLGAKLPKGVLLVGPPGVGKTLLARAVAGEAGVPFFHASGSEFDEMFVGVGAKRLRQLFQSAKEQAPCIIFIDEFDSVGAKRTASTIHPYANQTINQLLSEMDGFSQNEGIIVLGATNKVENMDKALRRPGRFDVEVTVSLPDLKGRIEIIELYINKVKKNENVDVEKLAKGTTGFSGAELQNLINQAALKAAIDGCESVNMAHLEYARDKIIMGPEKRSKIPDELTNRTTAFHEAGHALVAFFTKDSKPLHKVTIIARGQSLGHTSFMDDKEIYNQNVSQLKALMDTSMGGRAAEDIMFGFDKITTGASSDISAATKIATAMVKLYGMSDKIGMRDLTDVSDLSDTHKELIDSEIKKLLNESYERARSILKQHNTELNQLANALLKYETLSKDEIKTVIDGKKLNKAL